MNLTPLVIGHPSPFAPSHDSRKSAALYVGPDTGYTQIYLSKRSCSDLLYKSSEGVKL